MADKYQLAYIENAFTFAKLSHGVRLKAGAVIVKDGSTLSYGYNGTPAGSCNICETKVDWDEATKSMPPEAVALETPVEENGKKYLLVTKPDVIHAELNAIAKLAKTTASSEGADIYITDSPCFQCSLLIYQAGIKRVFYRRPYRLTDGIDFLRGKGVHVEQI